MKMRILKFVYLFAVISLVGVSLTNSYFTDEDSTAGTVLTAGNWHSPQARVLISELYYLGDEEWIELYNAGDAAANIKGWEICSSNNQCGRLNPAKKTDLSPGEYVLVSHDNADLKDWDVPKNIATINYAGGKISFDDSGAAVTLKNNQGLVIDQISYGNDTQAFTPACQTVSVRHSLQRNPTGVDTDTCTDFIDQPSPTPGR